MFQEYILVGSFPIFNTSNFNYFWDYNSVLFELDFRVFIHYLLLYSTELYQTAPCICITAQCFFKNFSHDVQ